MENFQSDPKTVKRVTHSLGYNLGDELRKLVAEKEAEWAEVPESCRDNVPRDKMDEFMRGWRTFKADGTSNILRTMARAGVKQHVFCFTSPNRIPALSPESLGHMRALTSYLLANDIEYIVQWDTNQVVAVYNVHARWAK